MTRPRSGWPSPVNADPWASGRPQPLMPGRKQGWPRGINTSADPAENLLSQAVGWWDAAYYTAGDRFLRNRGVAGELLDMRLGSSLAANSNDPLYLAPEATGYSYLPGVAGNYLSVPDGAATSVTGDLEVIWYGALDDWTPTANQNLVAKYGSSGQQSYRLIIATGGQPYLIWTADGTNALGVLATAAPSIADGAALWIKATLDVDDGAGNRVQKYWTSTNGSTWTQLGNTITTAGTTSIFDSTSATFIAGRGTGSTEPSAFRFYRAIVKDGIDGTTVLDVDCDVLTSGSATSFTEQSSNAATVTINRSSSGRKTKPVPAAGRGGRREFLLGLDDFFEIPAENVWQHQLLNFGQGDSFTAMAVYRMWATVANTVMAKKAGATSATVGWAITHSGGEPTGRFSDGVTQASPQAGLLTAGARTLVTLLQRVNGVRSTSLNAETPVPSSTAVSGSLVNTEVFRIGRLSGAGTDYSGIEFTAAAVFRRGLTQAELTTLSTYFQNRTV